MQTRQVYERIMMSEGVSILKGLRDRWYGDNTTENNPTRLFSANDITYQKYKNIMDDSLSTSYDILNRLIIALLREYGYNPIPVCVSYEGKKRVKMNNSETELPTDPTDKRGFIFSFIVEQNHNNVLYVFREYGQKIYKMLDWPEPLIEAIRKEYSFDDYRFVLYVKDRAYTEIVNHNNDENDLCRGTKLLSIQDFFESVLCKEEYGIFLEYEKKYTKAIKEYFGLVVVQTMQPNAIHNFKMNVKENIEKERDEIIGVLPGVSLNKSQRQLIDNQYYTNGYSEALTGSCDFAVSFMTAEWLYGNLERAGRIDYTAISMGYFKAVEQFLYAFLSRHTKEKDGGNRSVSTKKNGVHRLTDSVILNEKNDLMLGSLTSFFGFKNKQTGQYTYRNSDLLGTSISKSTHECIIDTLEAITSLRNGYFHKDNMEIWDQVVIDRKKTLFVFYLLLGAYNYSEDDKKELGIIPLRKRTEFDKLCEYLNHLAYEQNEYQKPILYLNDYDVEYDFYFVCPDNKIVYDKYGEATYSGIYFQAANQPRFFCNEENVPFVIHEGRLIFEQSIPVKITPSGPQKKIFENGRFIGQ